MESRVDPSLLTCKSISECNYSCLEHDYAEKKAKEANCGIVYADDTTLQLDLDGDEAITKHYEVRNLLEDLGFPIDLASETAWNSKGGRGLHVQLKLTRPLPAKDRILLQALLGSDIKREALSLVRTLNGQEHPILLFRPNVPVPSKIPYLEDFAF
jgi:hypothetical protein